MQKKIIMDRALEYDTLDIVFDFYPPADGFLYCKLTDVTGAWIHFWRLMNF